VKEVGDERRENWEEVRVKWRDCIIDASYLETIDRVRTSNLNLL